MYKTVSSFVNSPEYLMLSSKERNIKEEELRKKEQNSKNGCNK
ncbi:MAG: hypothetical protein PWP71_2363 [Clostridia bacterium]|jgi:hypothetical protein|nr:hypothetical protein [Clostridia bacterium]